MKTTKIIVFSQQAQPMFHIVKAQMFQLFTARIIYIVNIQLYQYQTYSVLHYQYQTYLAYQYQTYQEFQSSVTLNHSITNYPGSSPPPHSIKASHYRARNIVTLLDQIATAALARGAA